MDAIMVTKMERKNENENEKWKKKGYNNGYEEGRRSVHRTTKSENVLPKTKELIRNILASLHPDFLSKKGKNFNDVKEVYYNLTNFYDKYLK